LYKEEERRNGRRNVTREEKAWNKFTRYYM